MSQPVLTNLKFYLMAIPRITADYAYMSDAALELKSQSIVAAVGGSPHFTTPVPSLVEVSGVIANYKSLLVEAQMRDKTKVATKNALKKELVSTIRALGNYVTQTAEGELEVLISSGFTLAKTGQAAPPITNPQDLQVENGLNSGEIITGVKAVKSAKAYIHQYTADPITDNSQWTSVASTKCKNVFTGLEPAKIYWFQIAAIGANEQIAYSEMLSKIVQ